MSQMYIIFPDKNTYLIFEKILPCGLWVSLYDDYLMPLLDARMNQRHSLFSQSNEGLSSRFIHILRYHTQANTYCISPNPTNRVSLETKELGVLPYRRLHSVEFKSSHTKVKQEFQAPPQPKGLFN